MPNIALIQELKERIPDSARLQMLYVGTRHGMERELVLPLGVMYKGIFCGKLRRYFSFLNLIDFFKIPIGVVQCLFAFRRFRPDVIFCKGGYVCFPVAVAGWMLRIPVILHESDVVPGLANRLSARFARVICVSFEETKEFFQATSRGRRGGHGQRTARVDRGPQIILTGNPVRRDLQFGNKADGLAFAGFRENIPVLLVMGGSQGADFINRLVWNHLNHFVRQYQIVHICGGDKIRQPEELLQLLSDENKKHLSRYRAFSFIGREMKDFYAAADLVICRSGAITLAEIDFVGLPAILIPLSQRASRGDQIDNAEVYAKTHRAAVIEEKDFEADKFFGEIEKLLGQRPLRSRGPQGSETAAVANEKIISLLLHP